MTPVVRAEPPARVEGEINHLMAYIGHSGCSFKRNSAWNDSKTAEAHVRKKYDYLVNRGLLTTTEDFINRAAAKSSTSGRPYEVRCGSGSPVTTNRWLASELARYRAKAPH